MTDVAELLESRFGQPACPQPDIDQGDPFLFVVPEGVAGAYRYYVVVTSPDFPMYGSHDLLNWDPLGPALASRHEAWCWAPCIRYVAGLERPWVMLYSKAKGVGEPEGHQNHVIRRADSVAPEGPYEDSGELLTESIDFAIDPEVAPRPGGGFTLYVATDFVEDAPLGTGLAELDISADLRRVESPPRPVARAGSAWQVYEPARSLPWMHIPGVDWERGDTVSWHCVEGPAVAQSPTGERILLYSGGNFADFYGVGILRQQEGRWVDRSPVPSQCLLEPMPAHQVYGPGHCSVAADADGSSYVCFHFRQAPEASRQFALLPLRWDENGLPYCRLPR